MKEGQIVIYKPTDQLGVVTSITDNYVFVRFLASNGAACRREDLQETSFYIGSKVQYRSRYFKIVNVSRKHHKALVCEVISDDDRMFYWSRNDEVPESYQSEHTNKYYYINSTLAELVREPKNDYEKELIELLDDIKIVGERIKE